MPYMGPDTFKTYPLRFGGLLNYETGDMSYFRHLRATGYGFGIADALHGSVTYPVVHGLRLMATGFIFAHTIARPVQVSKRTNSSLIMATSAADTFLYEAVVSGFVPPLVAANIRRLVSKSCPPTARAWLPAAASLASLPIVIPTCDHMCDVLMDATIRQVYP